MAAHYLIQLVFLLTGVVTLLASLLDWNWFFTARNTQFAIRSVGRKRARLYYGILGVLLVCTAVWFYLHTPSQAL